MMKELTGRHVFAVFALGFGTIIAVNVTLAVNAVRSFPGLEVKNSYVASQHFDAAARAQVALGWDVSARLAQGVLQLSFEKDGQPVAPVLEKTVLGKATSVAQDEALVFEFDGTVFTAPVEAEGGNLNLRLVARAADGTLFQQRVIVEVMP